eukprot:2994964-Rhodomonas_salina.3
MVLRARYEMSGTGLRASEVLTSGMLLPGHYRAQTGGGGEDAGREGAAELYRHGQRADLRHRRQGA